MMKDAKKKIAIFVYSSSDKDLAQILQSQIQALNFFCVYFGEPLTGSEELNPSNYFGIILLSKRALTSPEFMSEWREIIFSQLPYFNIRLHADFVPFVPPDFGQIHYFDLEDQTINRIINAVELGTDVEQTKKVANTDVDSEKRSIHFDVFETQSLRRAWVKILKYASQEDTYYDQYAYVHYNQHIEANLLTLEELLKSDRFKFEPLLRISIPKTREANAPKRYLYHAQPETAVVLQAICDAISPSIERVFIKQSYGNRFIVDRREETTNIFKDYWEQYQSYRQGVRHFAENNTNMYYHRVDIKQYYPRISIDKLLEMTKHFVDDSMMIEFIRRFLNLESITEEGNIETPEIHGLPAGIPISHLFGNLFLHDVDLHMRDGTRTGDDGYGYFRYVDDVVFFGETVEDTEAQREIFERLLLNKLNLPENEDQPLNQEKSTTRPLPAGDPELLATKLKGISGTLRLSRFPNLSQNEQHDVARTIYELLFEGSDEDGGLEATAELTRYTTMGIRRLVDLDFGKDKISMLIVSLLSNVALPSHNIKYLVNLLLDHFRLNPSNELLDLLKIPNTPIHLAVLQGIRKYPSDQIADSIWQWVRNQVVEQNNYILLREAALSFCHAPPRLLKDINFKSLYDSANPLARPYVLQLGLRLDLQTTQQITLSTLSKELIYKRAALRILEEMQDWFVEDIPIEVTDEDDSETIIRIIYLTLKHSIAK